MTNLYGVRNDKLKLIRSANPTMEDLYDKILDKPE